MLLLEMAAQNVLPWKHYTTLITFKLWSLIWVSMSYFNVSFETSICCKSWITEFTTRLLFAITMFIWEMVAKCIFVGISFSTNITIVLPFVFMNRCLMFLTLKLIFTYYQTVWTSSLVHKFQQFFRFTIIEYIQNVFVLLKWSQVKTAVATSGMKNQMVFLMFLHIPCALRTTFFSNLILLKKAWGWYKGPSNWNVFC